MNSRQDSERDSFWDPHLTKVFDISLDAVIAIDESGTIIAWNAQATKLFGWDPEDVVGRTLVDTIIRPIDAEIHRKGLRRYLTTGEAHVLDRRVELTGRSKSGEEIPVELSASELAQGGERYFIGYLRDLRDRKRYEQALLREALEAKVLEQATRMMISVGSHEEAMLRCLATICEKTNWPTGHVLLPNDVGTLLITTEMIYADDQQRFSAIYDLIGGRGFQPGESLPGQILLEREPIWVEDIGADPLYKGRDELKTFGVRSAFGFPVLVQGQVAAVLEFLSDEPRRLDPQLIDLARRIGSRMGELIEIADIEKERTRIAAIVESSYDAIIGKDLDGTIISWNAGAEITYGYSEEEAVGQSVMLLLPDDAKDEEPEVLAAMTSGTRLEQFETLRRRKDGKIIPVSVTVSPISDESGKITGSSTIERNISDRKRHESELQRARDVAETARQQAESALSVRRDFLANVSHELRTPMNATLGMLELSLDEDISPTVEEYLKTAKEAANSLLTLLNDILDFSRMEAGKFTIDYEPFDVRDMLDETMKTVSSAAFNKGLELACDVDPDTPEMLIGDELRLKQVLLNLIGNAIKFTEEGEIVVSIKTVRRWPQEVRLRFSVSDTGVGISEEDQEQIFGAFAQADSSSTRNHGGVGLGLAISSELLRLMGSRIRLESKVGEGSNFSFVLSLHRIESSVPKRTGVPLDKLKGLSVLVVDDNATNLRILDQTLRNWDMAPTLASDGEQAIALMRRAAEENKPFAIAIVDALMPGIDGLSLAREINNDPIIERPPVMLMISSTDRQAVLDREESDHISSLLSKPISQSDLLDAVFRCLKVVPPETTETVEGSIGELIQPLSVLVVEDTPASQKVVATMLKKRGHHVVVADNGREAVDVVAKSSFDVVLMDVQMPIMDGYQATAAIRKLDKEYIPIIAMTAHAMRGDREKCLRAGMDSYLSKPVDAEELLQMVESVSESEDQTSLSRKRDAKQSEKSSGTELLDIDAALGRIRNDKELLAELIDMFEEDAPKLLDTIHESIESKDYGNLTRSAHSLKGLAANFSAEPTAGAAFKLEQMGEQEQIVNAAESLSELKENVAKLIAALRRYQQG